VAVSRAKVRVADAAERRHKFLLQMLSRFGGTRRRPCVCLREQLSNDFRTRYPMIPPAAEDKAYIAHFFSSAVAAVEVTVL
jgi:hypothetical protein